MTSQTFVNRAMAIAASENIMEDVATAIDMGEDPPKKQFIRLAEGERLGEVRMQKIDPTKGAVSLGAAAALLNLKQKRRTQLRAPALAKRRRTRLFHHFGTGRGWRPSGCRHGTPDAGEDGPTCQCTPGNPDRRRRF